MKRVEYLLTKAGPRLLDALVDSPEIEVLVTAPGMLFKRLEFVTNLDAFEGCDAGFYAELAEDMVGTIYCGHQAPIKADIRLEPHRIGVELTIELDPPTMYQSLLLLRTRSGRTFRETIMESRSVANETDIIAVFYVVRAASHHEHHASATKQIREHAQLNHETH